MAAAMTMHAVDGAIVVDRYLPRLGLGALAVIRNKWIHMVMAIVMLLGILSGVPFMIFN